MSLHVVLAAFLAAMAVALLASPGRPPRRRPGPVPRPGAAPPLVLRLRPVLAALTVVGGWSVLGGLVGAVVGAVVAAVLWRLLAGTETGEDVARREQLVRDLPLAVDLLVSCLRSGAAIEGSLGIVADAVGGQLALRLRTIDHRLALGLDPRSVWREVADDPELAALGRAVGRAHESGASVVDAVGDLAADLRERERTEAQVRANAVEVRAAGPLAACFLPAFVLIGIVPLIAGAVSSLPIVGP